MSHPRYQIFVSSTFEDLKEEREAVLNAILKLNQFPAGMEIFPAANNTPWELIQEIIKESDYYVLIIGGRYGSMDETGLSFTEKEYDFAVSQKIPVLAFIHDDPENIPVGKSESNKKIQKKLDEFKRKVEKHHRKPWKTINDLKEGVLVSLMWSFNTNPQIGWVKADGIDNKDLLKRLAGLQQKYDNLVKEKDELQKNALSFETEQFAYGEEIVALIIRHSESKKDFVFELSWNDIFFYLGEFLIAKSAAEDIRQKLSSFIITHFMFTNEYLVFTEEFKDLPENKKPIKIHHFSLMRQSFKIVQNQLLALDLIIVSEISSTSSAGMAGMSGRLTTGLLWTWQLSEKGKKLYLNKKAIGRKY